MTIRRISSDQPYEEIAGYCRAVVAGGFVHVAGTIGDGDDVVSQCKDALARIDAALTEAGCSFADVVRVTYMLPDRDEFPACLPILKATFGANPPAATMIQCGLIDEEHRIEIEVTALLPNGGRP